MRVALYVCRYGCMGVCMDVDVGGARERGGMCVVYGPGRSKAVQDAMQGMQK